MSKSHRGVISIDKLVTFLLFSSLFILGMPLDGQVGQYSGGTLAQFDLSSSVQVKGGGARETYVAIVWGGFYLIAFFLFFRRANNIAIATKIIPFYILFIAYLCFSIFWSSDPEVGLLNIVQLIGSVVIAIIIAFRYQCAPDSLIMHVALAFGVAQLISMMLVLLAPSLGIAPNGRWAGMYGAPNYLGSLAFCALWANVAVVAIVKPANFRWFVIFALVSLANLVGTNSITSIGCAVLGLGFLWLWPYLVGGGRVHARNRIFALFLCVFIVLGYLFGVVNAIGELLFSFSGRSSNLTGRADIWNEALWAISQAPIFGHGFGSTLELVSVARLTDLHSAYINALFLGGVIALSLLLLSIAQGVHAVLRLGKTDIKTSRIFGSMLIAILAYNLTETALFDPRSPLLILFVIIIVFVSVVKRSP